MKNRLLSTIGILGIALMMVGCSNSETSSSNTTSTNVGETISNPTIQNTNVIINSTVSEVTPTTMQEAIQLVHDSVVTINVSTSSGTGSGAGVLVGYSETDSFIMTCHHVIDGGYAIEVLLNNGDDYTATLIGGDPNTDIAVISIPKVDLCYANIVHDSSTVALGSSVFAIGNPLGTLGGSVTSGIISATSRDITMSDGTVMNLMQTDAAINSGNSGGGLFNTNGELIGIVNAKYSASGIEGLGFAIPMSTAIDISTELIEKGYVEGRYNLGVTLADGGYYVYVYYIEEAGCAYGLLKTSDIITNVSISYKDGREAKSLTVSYQTGSSAIYQFIYNAGCQIGDTITFTVQRGRFQTTMVEISVELTQYVYQMPKAE